MKLSLFLVTTFAVTANSLPVKAESLIDCNAMTKRTSDTFLAKIKASNLKAIKGFEAEQMAIAASVGLQQRNEYKSTHQGTRRTQTGEKMKLDFIDGWRGEGFFAKGNQPGGWNDQFIDYQLKLIVRSLEYNARQGKTVIYYGIDFTSNGSKDERRQCAGAIVYSIPEKS